MAEWIRLCALKEVPEPGKVAEAEANGVMVCLANVGGELRALANECPHRRAPLGQGWLEGDRVVCPWHSWEFDTATGIASYPEGERVDALPVRVEGEDVLIDLA